MANSPTARTAATTLSAADAARQIRQYPAESSLMTVSASLVPYGTLPSPRQIRHHAREFYGFVHFTINTFTDKEWGFGDESPALFDPSDFDAAQIVGAAADAGMAGLILTCKHHDGFCLWPTATTTHSVKSSPFRDGNGDVVREISDACREAGIAFGVYLSPWDRNNPLYGTPDYVTEIYRPQLRELLTNYGPLFEVWFDGANGGDGYYGGARETRKIDPSTYYRWDETWEIVRELQPDAVMFSDAGPDVRWIGNENGIAGDPCWSTLILGNTVPGVADRDQLNRGDRNGDTWLIPECDVSIRPGWFWHASEEDRVRSGKNLVDLYFQSVGRSATFLLNLTPDRRGRVPHQDIASLRTLKSHLSATFARNLAHDATIEPAPKEGLHTVRTVTLTLPSPITANVLQLREDLRFGQRVDSWALDAWQNDTWETLLTAEAIGAQRLVRFAVVTAARFRLRITGSPVDQPALSEIALFFEPELTEVLSVSSAEVTAVPPAAVTQPDDTTLLLDLSAVPSLITPSLITALRYTPNTTDGHLVDQYTVSVSADGSLWEEILRGEFSNMQNNPIPQTLTLPAGSVPRFVRFQALRFASGNRLVVGDVSALSSPHPPSS
jgi:alpha-L-fucosidase